MSKPSRASSYFDYTLLFLIIFTVAFGMVMLYSTSSYEAMNQYGDSMYFVKRQLRSVVIGLVLMVALCSVNYKILKKLSMLAYLLSFILCLAVIFVGTEINGSKRWLSIGGLSIQPSEIAKIGLIIFVAAIISKMPRQLGNFKNYIKVVLMVIPIVGIVAYSNLSTAIILMGIVLCMLFVAGPKVWHFGIIMLLGVAAGGVFILTQGYRSDRITAWLNLEASSSDLGYQTLQGLYAIGSGGIFGKGLGESIQKLGHLPEAQNDMIFSIICEELGLFGAICVILLFVLMLWRFMMIANNADDLFGSMLVVGVFAHIALQVVLNIAVVTNTIPNTGVILPFISYGGTSEIFLLAEMGMVLGVSRGIRFRENESQSFEDGITQNSAIRG